MRGRGRGRGGRGGGGVSFVTEDPEFVVEGCGEEGRNGREVDTVVVVVAVVVVVGKVTRERKDNMGRFSREFYNT